MNITERLALIRKLFDLGYFAGKTWIQAAAAVGDENVLAEIVRRFKEFHGLPDQANGLLDDSVQRQLNRPRCAMPDFMTAEATCKWPRPDIKWLQQVQLPTGRLSAADVQRAFEQAYGQWAAVCGIRPTPTNTAALANIVSRSGTGRGVQLDGAGGTLAWSELPCGAAANTQLQQMYDTAEAWSYDMLVAVACHEIGHALGLPHLREGNLMAPYYDPAVTKPQPGDVVEMLRRYGPPAAAPTPPAPNPTNPTNPATPPTKQTVDVLVRVDGVVYAANGLPLKP